LRDGFVFKRGEDAFENPFAVVAAKERFTSVINIFVARVKLHFVQGKTLPSLWKSKTKIKRVVTAIIMSRRWLRDAAVFI
jgi:hypothetical protein